MVEAIAAGLGYTVRALLLLVRWLVAASGPALVIFGVAKFSVPASAIVAGLILIWLNSPPREDAK